MKTRLILAAMAALTCSISSSAFAAASPGETVFQQRCSVCHAMAPAPGKMGPVLKGVVGRKAGSVPGFAYSPALKSSNITWSTAQLDTFLKGPQKLVPGTKMMMVVPDATQRGALVQYLASVK